MRSVKVLLFGMLKWLPLVVVIILFFMGKTINFLPSEMYLAWANSIAIVSSCGILIYPFYLMNKVMRNSNSSCVKRVILISTACFSIYIVSLIGVVRGGGVMLHLAYGDAVNNVKIVELSGIGRVYNERMCGGRITLKTSSIVAINFCNVEKQLWEGLYPGKKIGLVGQESPYGMVVNRIESP